MYDEYYYYVEFDGNGFLAALTWVFVFINYLRVHAWHVGVGAMLLLVVPALLCLFFWHSWNQALTGFFDDLTAAARNHN